MRIAVIPARGGSKRIPRKNIKEFCGKPMIAWSIEAARASALFDHIIVSTDDTEIADIAKQWGAEVPFLRPVELSDDYATTTEVVAHAIDWAVEQSWEISAVCCIYATAPFVEVDDIKRGLNLLESASWDFAFSATDFAAPIFRAFKQLSEGGVEMLYPEYFNTRSQDLPRVLHDAGQFYWGRPDAWTHNKPVFGKLSTPVILSRLKTQDIDTPEDWAAAELLFKISTK